MRRWGTALAIFIAAAIVPRQPCSAADGPPARPARAICYTVWDDDFLFLAAKVDDSNLIGSNNTAMSEPWRDDSVEFYFDASDEPSDTIHPGCARVAVSAASGFTCLVGTGAGTWRAQPEWLLGLKLAVEHEGTLNKPEDVDVGYVVELGIPWKFLGGALKPGRRIGFNFVVNVRGENEGWIGWSSRVRSRDDLDRPDRWGSLIISGSTRPSVAENDVLICPRTYSPPLVDGRLKANEWMAASVIQVEKPAPEVVFRPATGKLGARLLATYRYDYQVPSPRQAQGKPIALSFAEQPPDGIGPWFSADSVAWHKAMLRQARLAAVDTILPIYRGDPVPRRDWSRRGLLRLVEALKETKDERLSYPLVGMYLDAGCLAEAGAPDLTTTAGKQALWGMIAEFYDIVPEEFRAQFDFGAPTHSNLLVLGPPEGVQKWDASFVDYCREAYQRTYGARLIVLGDEGWRSSAPNLDGYCSLAPGIGLSYGKAGPRSFVRLTPGYLGTGQMMPRHGGQTYERNWMTVLAALPDFVLVDSLNDFEAGTEIAASRQHGARFLDATRQSAQTLAGRQDYRVALRRETFPRVFNPGATYQIELLVENQGFQNLTEGENVEISYRLQNRSRADLKATGIATGKLLVLAGQRAPVVVEVSTRTFDKALPPGDYDLTFEVTKGAIPILRTKWLAKHLFEMSVPVRLDRARANQATVLSTGLPSALGAGERRRVRVRLRNDGSNAWNARDVALSYHWVRTLGSSAAPGARPEMVEFEGVRTALPQSVEPGRMITLYAWVEAKKADGTPLPAWTPDEQWLYQVQWDLVEGKDRWFSRGGGETCAEVVAVVASDLGAAVVNADLPASLEAGKAYQVKALVRNDGAGAWDPHHVRLSYHWHYWDGAEAAWQGAVTPLPAAVAAGDSALVTAQVTAPDFSGSYRLAWELMLDDRFASEMLDASSRSILVQPVTVTGGVYEPLDLTGQSNVAASTYDGYRSRGAFDGGGFSFPAEFLPPAGDGSKTLDYPGVFFGGERGWDSLARVPLRYPPMDQRGAAAIACRGQEIALPKEPLGAIYIAASSSEAVAAEFRIAYADGSGQPVVLQVPSWVSPPAGAAIAVRAPFVRATADDVQAPASIYLLRIGDIGPKQPAALVLPAAPQIKIFAITIERPTAAKTGGA
jgi:hypothetical protein